MNSTTVDDLFPIDDANDESRDIIFTLCVEARHLGRLAAQQHTSIFAAAGSDAFDDAPDCFRRETAGRNVIEKEKRTRALDQNVIDAVIHQIAANCIVSSRRERDLQFGAHTVGRSDQHRLPHVRKSTVEHAAKAADV